MRNAIVRFWTFTVPLAWIIFVNALLGEAPEPEPVPA
jgi:hypothetical protein